MKLIHTADWHIGKLLLDKSRLQEQEIVLRELADMADTQGADVVCISGDIYDNGSPSAAAEELFCRTVEALSRKGERLVVIIAGNHDKPERLEALRPLARRHGILIFGTPGSVIEDGTYGHFRIHALIPGVFETKVGDETAVFACVPYASEKLLGTVIYEDTDTEEEQIRSYEEKMRALFDACDAQFRDDAVNICLSHVFTAGYAGDASERSTQLGGSYLLSPDVFPKRANYIALGHVHKPQSVPGSKGRARYSGAILPYHSDETVSAKLCNLVEVHPGEEPVVTPLYFSNPKPVERWNCENFAEAAARCKESADRPCWVFLKIKTKQPLLEDQIRELKNTKKDLLEITPVLPDEEKEDEEEVLRREENVLELFKKFYKEARNAQAGDELLGLLAELLGEET